ncbi:MAG: hypothetical protein IJ344_04130, partial [Clostridia bacterium]|nr:hypothetical protein [Clostridia bacterium]
MSTTPERREILPCYEKQPTWECYAKELDVELKQSIEEGKDIEQYKELFETVFRMPENKYKNEIADVLYKLVMEAPQKEGYPYVEPSDIEGIRAARAPLFALDLKMPDDETL